jgi:hypothetical protein
MKSLVVLSVMRYWRRHVSTLRRLISTWEAAYLALDDGAQGCRAPSDDTVDQGQVEGILARGAEEQVLVAAAGLEEVVEAVVDDRELRVLDDNTETFSNGVGQRRLIGDLAGHGHGGGHEAGEELTASHCGQGSRRLEYRQEVGVQQMAGKVVMRVVYATLLKAKGRQRWYRRAPFYNPAKDLEAEV